MHRLAESAPFLLIYKVFISTRKGVDKNTI